MPTVKNFEDLDCWKKARELASRIYELTRKDNFRRDFGLRDQIQRAAGSVMHNIAEGFEAGTDPEFIRFLRMARRSASEIQSELYLAYDCEYISADERQGAHALATEVKRLTNGMISYLRNSSPKKQILTNGLED
jgi:four helix bundle protein